MSRRESFILALWSWLCLSISPASAYVKVKQLTDTADLIAVAKITNAIQSGSAVSVTLWLERVLKGSLQPSTSVTVNYTFPPDHQGPKTVTTNQLGLFFMKSDSRGSWNLLPVDAGALFFSRTYFTLHSAEPPQKYSYASDTPVIDKVASELAEAADRSGAVGYEVGLAGVLSVDDCPTAANAYRAFSQSSQPALRRIGLTALVLHCDLPALLIAEGEAVAASRSKRPGVPTYGIGGCRPTDPVAIGVFGRLATDWDHVALNVRIAAVLTLRAMHTKATLPYLIRVLDSPEKDLRSLALFGLNAFVTGIPSIQIGDSELEVTKDVMKPGKPLTVAQQARQIISDDAASMIEPYIRFGYYATPDEEWKYINQWKQWWQRYGDRITH